MQSRLLILGIPVRINWSDMGVGDSLFIPAPTGISERLKTDLLEAAGCTGYKIAVLEVAEKGFMGVRVWRVG